MMNERIRELWDRAAELETDPSWQGQTKFIEKFAELIVRECAGICMEMATKCAGLPGDGALARDCADWIKKDFGVNDEIHY